MSWKCEDCRDFGPEYGVLWCPDCGSRNIAPTDADGLTASDRYQQFLMDCEELGIDPATHTYTDNPARYDVAPPPKSAVDLPSSPGLDLDDSIPF